MNTVTEGKMWFLHCQLLTEIMAQILKMKEIGHEIKHKDSNGFTFIKDLFKNIVTEAYENIQGDIVDNQKDSEYIFFRKTLKNRRKDEIFSIIDGLSGPAFRVASTLMRDSFSRDGEMEEKPKETALWFILAIGYFNRKICLGAEGVVYKNKDKEDSWCQLHGSDKVIAILDYNDNDSKAMQLFLNCLRPRLNYIGAVQCKDNPFEENQDGEYEIKNKTYNVETLVKLSEGLSKDEELDVPFSRQIHRIRGIPVSNPLDAHLLGIDAGAHINAITQESTLGKIRQSLGLPLRCDISGTTVDAMGFCDTFIKINSKKDSNKEERMAYLVSCMLSMCLTGHHSLDEMALALSLDVEKKYDPCNPASVIDLLKEWSGWTNFELPDANDAKYFKRKAKEILGPDSLKTLEFTRELWDGLATHNKIMKGWTYSNGGGKLTYPNKANRNSND